MYNFTFHRPTTVRQAAGLLARNPEAKLLAGGHSLMPVMKQRLAQPSALIDLSLVEGMAGVELKGRSVVIGAMTRHADVANSQVLQGGAARRSPRCRARSATRRCATAAPSAARSPTTIRTPIIRRRCLGLGATIITNKRRIAADDFFTGMFSTALEDGEIITKVSFPIAKKAAYEKFKHPASGFALVGVFVSKRGADIRVAVTGAGANGVFRVKSFEEALKKRFAAKSLEGMTHPGERHEQRHPRQRRISRASGRRAGAPRAGEGDGVIFVSPHLNKRTRVMITAVVTFKVPKEMTRDKALELFKSRAPIFQNIPGLISEQFLFDADRNVAGGVSLWESRAVADACYQGPWKDGIRKLALSEPEIAWFDSPVVINNETRQAQDCLLSRLSAPAPPTDRAGRAGG